MPTVAIVGRKNVGKSSIFNRLIGKRLSVVHSEPGVTRDRLYGEVSWRGRSLNIIDTGGFFPDEDDALAEKITQQIEFALREADLIYFVVDAKTGLMPADELISRNLRKLNKEIFLLVNKIDSKKGTILRDLRARINEYLMEFSKLGIDRIFPVSAEAGIGLGDVLDETIKFLPETGIVKECGVIKLLILGRPNAGKSTLLNTILKQERAVVDERPGTTRDLVNAKFEYRNQIFEIIDTCGLKKLSRVKNPIEFYSMMRVMRVIDGVDVAVILFDVMEGVVKEDLRITSLILSKAKGMIIAPNKIDLIKKQDLKKVFFSTRKSFDFIEFVPIAPISAKNNIGIENLLNIVISVYGEYTKNVDNDTLNSIIPNIKPPPDGTVMKISQVGKRPPVFQVNLTSSVKENYVKYLRNTMRNYFGFSGVPILIKTKIIKGRKRNV